MFLHQGRTRKTNTISVKEKYVNFVIEDDFYVNEIGKASCMGKKGLIPFTSCRFKVSCVTLRTYACMRDSLYIHIYIHIISKISMPRVKAISHDSLTINLFRLLSLTVEY